MTDQEADQLLAIMQYFDHKVDSYEAAVEKAMNMVPLVKENLYFGEVEDRLGNVLGTFYFNTSDPSPDSCRWFDLTMSGEVVIMLLEQERKNLT